MLELPPVVKSRNVLLQRLKSDRQMVLRRKFADLGKNAERIEQVDNQNPEKRAEEERQHQIVKEPVDNVIEDGMNHIAVERAEQRPVERELGADDPLNVPPFLAVVPKLDVHPHNEDLARNVFDNRHRHTDEQNAHEHARHGRNRRKVNRRKPVQHPESEAVKRQEGSHQKARVHPLFCRKDPTVKQLENPPERSAEIKQQHQCQKDSDNKHIPSSPRAGGGIRIVCFYYIPKARICQVFPASGRKTVNSDVPGSTETLPS